MPRADLALEAPPPPPAAPAGPLKARGFLPKLAATAAAVALGLLAIRLADVLLLAFGAVLVAILLQAAAGPLQRRLHLRRPVALVLAVVIIVGLLSLVLWVFGQQASLQLAALVELMPGAWTELQARLSASPLGAYLLQDLTRLQPADGRLVAWASQLARGASTGVAAAVIVFFAGLYLAFHPGTYVGGLIRLTPPAARPRAAAVLASCGEALHRWLIGQLISMALVGLTTGIGLWLAGVPAPMALGVLAGLGQFIPVVGPGAAMIPGLLIALAQGPQTLGWAALIYVGAMQFEANIMTPLLLRRMVELPMAVTLFAVLAMGVLLGPLGVLFATPLAVVAYVLVRAIYVEDLLERRTP